MSIASEITRLQNAKASLKTSIEGKGVSVSSSATLDEYASFVDLIPNSDDIVIPLVRRSITSIDLRNLDRAIGNYAFARCISLESVYAPNVSVISDYAFMSTRLSVVDFPITRIIGSHCFAYCGNLTDIRLPSLSSMGQSAFYSCTKLTNITSSMFGSSLTTISYNVFEYCSGLITVELPYIESIMPNAFSMCKSLTTASFASLKSLSGAAFYGCNSLTSFYAPELKSINGYAVFNSCYYITNFSFPKLEYISGSATFRNCSALTSIEFPALKSVASAYIFSSCHNISFMKLLELTNTYQSAFCAMTGLQTVILSNISSISASTFYNCSALEYMYLLGSSLATLANANAFTGTPIKNSSYTGTFGSIFVKSSLYSSYIASTNWVSYSARFVSLTDAQIQNVLSYGTHNP